MKVTAADRHRHTASPKPVGPEAGGDTVGQFQQNLISLFQSSDIVCQGRGNTVTLGLLRLRQHRRIIDPVGIPVQLLAEFVPQKPLEPGQVCGGQFPDGVNISPLQLPGRGPAHREQLPHRQRPELAGDFFREQGVDFIGLFKIAGHFGKELIHADTHVHGKAQLFPDRVLDAAGHLHWVGIQPAGAGHIQKALVNGELLHHRGHPAADIHKGLGIPLV